jgi:hypothetical protein
MEMFASIKGYIEFSVQNIPQYHYMLSIVPGITEENSHFGPVVSNHLCGPRWQKSKKGKTKC